MVKRFGALCPTLKRNPRRPGEWIERGTAERVRKAANNAAGPAVKRVRIPIPGLGRCGECIPTHLAGETQKHDGGRGAFVRERRHVIVRRGMKRATPSNSRCSNGDLKFL